MKRIPHYILAGGRSRRFGSDKARAKLDGRALILRVSEGFAGVSRSTHVVAARAGQYADLGLETLADTVPDAGPLGGLCTALRHRRDHVGVGRTLVTSCDLLEPYPRWIAPLWTACDGCAAAAVVYQNATGCWQPMPGLYHTDLLPRAQAALDAKRGAMWRVIEEASAVGVPLPAAYDAVPQANTPEQLSSGLAISTPG